MTSDAEARRESFETGLGAIAHARARLGLVSLRVKQAEQYGSVGVLTPAVDDLKAAIEKLELAQQEFGDLWEVTDWEV